MQRIVFGVLLFLSTSCATVIKVASSNRASSRAPSSDTALGIGANERLTQVFSAHVFPLEREMWTFRYEHDDTQRSVPENLSALASRESAWSTRFFDPAIMTGDDVGPGLFVATDPNATATWGMTTPHLIAIKLKIGTQMLAGDLPSLTAEELAVLQKVSDEMHCQDADDLKVRPIKTVGEAVGAFRNSKELSCRQLVTDTLAQLKVQSILYSFYSVTLNSCRLTGTAVNIIDPASISLNELNYYSRVKTMEGSPNVTPFIKVLFREGRDDYQAQATLHNEEMLAAYRDGFGFFRNVEDPLPVEYQQWKMNSIFKCGPRWSSEIPTHVDVLRRNMKSLTDRTLQDQMIHAALAYQSKAEKDLGSPGIARSFNAAFLKIVEAAEFRGSTLPQGKANFERWKAAKDHAFRTNSLSEFAALYGEPVPTLQLSVILAKVSEVVPVASGKDALAKPQLLYVVLKQMGLGPQSARLVADYFILSNGTAPILKGPLPLRMADDASALFRMNRQLLSDMITKCTIVYRDPNSTLPDISKGDCSIATLY